MTAQPIVVTGAAGFLGYHTALALLAAGRDVVGVDNLNAYYDPKLKRDRLDRLTKHSGFRFVALDLADREAASSFFAEHHPAEVVHFAAQVGVRHSLENPLAYARDNLGGFAHVLEGCRRSDCRHLVYASSSSVYGGNSLPFREAEPADSPLNFYAATKRANELMAHSYGRAQGLRTTGLRFFTVYGPWGRPDMAIYRFASAIAAGRPVRLFGAGTMRRDFTEARDATQAVLHLLDRPPAGAEAAQVYNVGTGISVEVTRAVELLEGALGRKAVIEAAPPQPGEAPETRADTSALERATGFKPSISLESGVQRFVEWFGDYHRPGK